jgi:potassium-transporting ATPase potassium-binding subunit
MNRWVSPVWFEVLAFSAILFATVRPLGSYMEAVFAGRRTFASPLIEPIERAIYAICRIDPDAEMHWSAYTFSLLGFSIVGIATTYAILRLQNYLPLNPQNFAALAPDSAWNTAVSFATTTDWQFYSGESTMSYFSQMATLAWQMFVAAGAGLAVAIALIRGFAREHTPAIGNFWVDLTRGLLYVLLPLSFVFALAFVLEGEPQNFAAYRDVKTLDGATQTLTGGPMASQESIKLLGGNGGGFVAANSSSPNENPSAITNFLQLIAMFLIPAGLTYTFGKMTGDKRQGWTLFAAMSVLFAAGVAIATPAELAGNPLIHALGVSGPNLEGKEARFGAGDAGLSLAVATDSTVGAGNFTYDSLTPVAELIAMADMQLGEVAFGGVGSGIFGMLAYVIVTVFVAGLMVGRTPEYLGNKLERREMMLAMLAILSFPVAILIPAAVACVVPQGVATLGSTGPHGFSELFYAFTSSAASNGSAMGGLGVNTFYNFATGLAMLIGRFAAIVPTLALAGALAAKPRNERTRGTLRTDTSLFVVLLVFSILIVGALTFLPADALGPIVEHILLQQGKSF